MMERKIIALLEEMKQNCLKLDAPDAKRLDQAEALNFAIFVLKRRESADEQIKWERDIAIGQLEEIGKSFGEVMDDVAKVVRCKDCKHRGTDSCYLYVYDAGYNEWGEDYAYEEDRTEDDFFCATGERK